MTGQVALQARLLIQGRSALVAVRLKVDRGQISEIEQLYDRAINNAAINVIDDCQWGYSSWHNTKNCL